MSIFQSLHSLLKNYIKTVGILEQLFPLYVVFKLYIYLMYNNMTIDYYIILLVRSCIIRYFIIDLTV